MRYELEVKFHRESQFGKVTAKGLHLLKPNQKALDDAFQKICHDGWDSVHIYSDKWSDLEAWSRPDSYAGPQYWGYVALAGRSRDSSILEETNFQSIKEDAESKGFGARAITHEDEEFPVLETASANHWAVGWVETLMVHWLDAEALDFAAEVRKALEGYPVYDDSAYSQACWKRG